MPTVQSERASIYYEVTGDGPAVALAHGRGGNAASWWQQVPTFAEHYTVITFDHRSYARSPCAADDFHPHHFAGDMIALLDAEGIDRAALVTQSMGGWTGMTTALNHPERVACLVLTSTVGGISTPAVQARYEAINRSQATMVERVLAPDFPQREPALTHLYEALFRFNTAVAGGDLSRLTAASAAIDPTALAGFAVPTLFIAAEYDALFPPAVLHEVAGLVPGAEIVDFPGSGHSPYWEDAAPYNEIVLGFLARHAPW